MKSVHRLGLASGAAASIPSFLKYPGSNRSSHWLRRVPWLLIPVMLLALTIAHAQQLTATLSGTVNDQTDARVANASITVKNEATGDTRTTKGDSSGFFSVTALVPGTYTVSISAKGFAPWQETSILLNQGDSRTVPNIHLKVGSETTAVTVISGEDAEVPVDNAEIGATLNNELVDSAVLTGRNAAELIKMMPGVAFSNGGGAGSTYNSKVTGTNNGPAGTFSANGTQPYGSTVVMLDGANLLDPGNAGTQVANINQDMTDSVSYKSASYGAEYAKGPAVLQAFSKSGGQKFHGEMYLYARNSNIGSANDWNLKLQQMATVAGRSGSTAEQVKAANKVNPEDYYYIGGNVGGPISFLGFNKNKDKLFFWGGYEYMIQHPFANPIQMNVPTVAQRAGDFTGNDVPQGAKNQWGGAYALPCATDNGWQGCNKANSPWVGDMAAMSNLSQYFDPVGLAVVKLQPLPNQTANQYNGWNNYSFNQILPQNRWEATGKITYAINDNNKVWGSYAFQNETDQHPITIWWAPTWTVPYPGVPVAKETATIYLANYTHVFSPTSTNEAVFAMAKFVNNNHFSKPSAATKSAIGLPIQSVFGTGTNPQMPNFEGSWANGGTWVQMQDFNSGIYGKGTFGKTSQSPSISDTFTKIIKTHSVKAGFYWDTEENLQANGGDTNGTYNVSMWGGTSTGNEVMDLLSGHEASYTESSSDPVPDIKWHQWSLWAQDSWKATSKLTINVGLRADHMGQWYDTKAGTQVWNPAVYVDTPNPPANTGLQTNKDSSKIPSSGWKSRLFMYDPRIGFAYDVFGTGKTVVRAGFGTYAYQVSGGDAANAMNGPIGQYEFNTGANGLGGFYSYAIQGGAVYTSNPRYNSSAQPVQLTVPHGLNQVNASSVYADKMGDDKVPYANTWSFGVAQAFPGHTVAEFSYVGSMSRNQVENGSNGHISDANGIPDGAYFNADPKSGKYYNPAPYVPGQTNVTTNLNKQHYRPLQNYGDVYLITHGGLANYHSLQVSAQKQSGNLYLFTNFTFGKVLGTRDGSTSNGNGNGPVTNPFKLSDNYGPLQYDHTKIFNFSASYKLPKFVKGNRLLGEVANGWQLTTYTSYEDGSPYQTQSANMNAQFNQMKDSAGNVLQTFTLPIPATADQGNLTQSIGTNTWYGSDQYPQMQPVLICDPRKGLHKGQQFNTNCFVSPMGPTATTIGQHGQLIWPYIRTPHYFGSDLAVFKAFRMTDSQRIEIRISATNWLNHPNAAFGINGVGDNQLQFKGASTSSALVHNSNDNTTGIPQAKQGYRWMQFAAKYYF